MRKMNKLIEMVKRSSDEGDAVGQCALKWIYENNHKFAKDETKEFKLYFLYLCNFKSFVINPLLFEANKTIMSY
jgi:hypothetical protein